MIYYALLCTALMVSLITLVVVWDANKQLKQQLETYKRRIKQLNGLLSDVKKKK
jgi:uncharacterized membrane protein affecting hemolysin expression